MRRIQITAGATMATAILNDSPTADALWDALPIRARANTWGDEIYFPIPVQMDENDDAREVVEVGDLGYWPPGHAFCIFFGRSFSGALPPAEAMRREPPALSIPWDM